MKTLTPLRALRILAAGAILVLSGCVPPASLHPIYTENEIAFDPALVGIWRAGNSKDTWEFFQRWGEKGYTLTHTDDSGKKRVFLTRLVKIKEHLFLDLSPHQPNLDDHNLHGDTLLPVHRFARIDKLTPGLTLALSWPDPIWFKNHLGHDPDGIRHEELHDFGPLLIGTPEKLQSLLLKAVKFDDSFLKMPELKLIGQPQR